MVEAPGRHDREATAHARPRRPPGDRRRPRHAQPPREAQRLSLDLRAELADALEREADDDDVACLVLTGAGTRVLLGHGRHAVRRRPRAQGAHRRDEHAAVRDRSPGCRRRSSPRSTARRSPAASRSRCCATSASRPPTATFGFPELGRHIPPSYGAALAALDPAVARRLCLTGEVLDAQRALALGVVSGVHDGRRPGARWTSPRRSPRRRGPPRARSSAASCSAARPRGCKLHGRRGPRAARGPARLERARPVRDRARPLLARTP